MSAWYNGIMPKLCSYVLTSDSGYAPNPYGGICTLAHCTPVNVRARLEPGDWIVGTAGVQRGYRLIYAMEVAEVLTRAQYMADPRFKGVSKPRAPRDDKPAFSSTHFYYFGCAAPSIPGSLSHVIYPGRGIKYLSDLATTQRFRDWMQGFGPGVHGQPLDPGRRWRVLS